MVEGARRGQDMTKKKNRMHIGTSGWQYAHWKGPFYPENLKKENYLSFLRLFFFVCQLEPIKMPDVTRMRIRIQ